MGKRALATLAAICMLLACPPHTVFAADETSAAWGDNPAWTLDANGIVTVSGIGYMEAAGPANVSIHTQ